MSQGSFDYWEYFAAETRRMGTPLYEALTLGVAGDEEIKALAHRVKPGQPPANVLFAAVHFLLLRGAQHRLRDYYPNLNGGERIADLSGAYAAFRDFLLKHRDELAPLIATRTTNTNEIGRSAALHAGFRAVAAEAGEPLHLVKIGPSAGLNLVWDRYGVRYVAPDRVYQSGSPEAKLVIETALRGEGQPPHGENPRIASRVGLERSPVDLSRPEERDWLRALVWPDQVERFTRLEAALALQQGETLPIRRGDALELLPEALAAIPRDEPACVYHTFVTYQFPDAARAALDDLLIGVSVRRPVWRLSWEGTLSGEAPLLLYSYRDGVREKRTLALGHPHGSWLEWQA
jgi:hypothetical protein